MLNRLPVRAYHTAHSDVVDIIFCRCRYPFSMKYFYHKVALALNEKSLRLLSIGALVSMSHSACFRWILGAPLAPRFS